MQALNWIRDDLSIIHLRQQRQSVGLCTMRPDAKSMRQARVISFIGWILFDYALKFILDLNQGINNLWVKLLATPGA